MNSIDVKINKIQQKLSQPIDKEILFNVLFEMNRYFDKEFVCQLHDVKANLNQSERNNLRLYFYYGKKEYLHKTGIEYFKCYKAAAKDKITVLDSCIDRCERYDENKIIKSIEEKYRNVSATKSNDNSVKWLKYYNKKRSCNSDFSLFILDYSQKDFVQHEYNEQNIFKIIADIYDHLENYRYFIFKLKGKLYNKKNEDITWKILYKIGIYCENFIQFSGSFIPFKKEKKIEELTVFLNNRFPENDNKTIAENFYSYISTGFKFEDCLVSDTQENVVLTFQKIKLDTTNIPCPACMTLIQSGNSFPEMFLRSFECKNPSCIERSKSGRGKRFDEYGTYRYFKLVENHPENSISNELYNQWRKDVFSNDNNIYDMLLKYYAWHGEKICVTKNIKSSTHGRKIKIYNSYEDSNYIATFEDLPIYKLFNTINTLLTTKTGNDNINERLCILNEDSTENISRLKKNQIGTAITSPPYYNAREYSQWSNLLLYLIDMQRNCNAVINTLKKDGYYLYNIGDIVSADNIYVSSNMSKRRLQLGFLSSMIFEICGFNLVGNIIWNKGEVQSKRNSTMNHNSGYVKCINCYEHFLVFKKGKGTDCISSVENISPVIKINSKGENLAKHTAPYPLELVNLAKPYTDTDSYILDPFLGSGTTLLWCKKNNYKGIGFEINDEYYKLSKNNVNELKAED